MGKKLSKAKGKKYNAMTSKLLNNIFWLTSWHSITVMPTK